MKYFPARAYHREMPREAELDLGDDPIPDEAVLEDDPDLSLLRRMNRFVERRPVSTTLASILALGSFLYCVSPDVRDVANKHANESRDMIESFISEKTGHLPQHIKETRDLSNISDIVKTYDPNYDPKGDPAHKDYDPNFVNDKPRETRFRELDVRLISGINAKLEEDKIRLGIAMIGKSYSVHKNFKLPKYVLHHISLWGVYGINPDQMDTLVTLLDFSAPDINKLLPGDAGSLSQFPKVGVKGYYIQGKGGDFTLTEIQTPDGEIIKLQKIED
jgi:hypothetical protein